MQGKQANKKTGNLGESITVEFLLNKGYVILERNVRYPFSELDIVARERKIIHFIEVKSVSYETKDQLEQALLRDDWRPEELVDDQKQKQLKKGIEAWLFKHSYTGNFKIDVVAVRFVQSTSYAVVNHIENVVL